MCRFVAYRGPPVRLDRHLYDPDHSIIRQAEQAEEAEETVNGDGWGVGWYAPGMGPEPALYRTVWPAWTDPNMRSVSSRVETPLYFAHVRAATPGLAVERSNCHPFDGGRARDRRDGAAGPVEEGRRRLLFMHNGRFGGHREVMRRLRLELPEEVYFTIRGTTDSEHAFAVIQDHLGEAAADPSVVDLVEATQEGLAYMEALKREVGAGDRRTAANVCLTDGESIVATRYASSSEDPAGSLYVGRARAWEAGDDGFGPVDPGEGEAVIVASERLTGHGEAWRPVGEDRLLVVDPDGEVWTEPLETP